MSDMAAYRQFSGWRREWRVTGIHAGEGLLFGSGVIRAAEAQSGSREVDVPDAAVFLH